MSRYTNDIDTLRQMINQALPMVLSSFVTIIAISAVMIGISVPLSVLAAAMIVLMLFVSRTLAGRCGRYFVAQQLAIGKVTGRWPVTWPAQPNCFPCIDFPRRMQV